MSVPEFNTAAPCGSAANSERHPGRRAAAASATERSAQQSTAEVASLKQSWAENVPGESFRNHVEEMPDSQFLKFVARTEDQFTQDVLQNALKAVHSLRSGRRQYEVAVTMIELMASRAYENLSDAEKWAARWCIDHQKQAERKS